MSDATRKQNGSSMDLVTMFVPKARMDSFMAGSVGLVEAGQACDLMVRPPTAEQL